MKEITPYRPEIRFSDVDAYGIVHNAKYIVYMEQARIHWWRQAMGDGTWDWSKVGVLVAHRLSTVMNAHKIAVVDQGSVVEEGTHDQLLEAGGARLLLGRDDQCGSRTA